MDVAGGRTLATIAAARPRGDEAMNESHFLRNAILFVLALVVAGYLAIWAIGLIFHLLGYIIVGALVIGGGYYLYKRTERGIASGRVRRRLRG